MSESGSSAGRGAEDDPRKEVLRLARRLRRLEATMQQLEELRDTNARLLQRLMIDLDVERSRSHRLLLNVLPQRIIDRLQSAETAIADRHDDVAVVFSDFVGFTEISSQLDPTTVVARLNAIFSQFDADCESLGLEKIKTIGDAYMAAAGLPGTRQDHVRAAAEFALAMRARVREIAEPWRIRIGVHRGPVIAGVMGERKFIYDLWGDTVNVASRLETTSLPDHIQVSERVAQEIRDEFHLEPRGEVELKGKGAMATYFLAGSKT